MPKETHKLTFKDFMYLTHCARENVKHINMQTTIDFKEIDRSDLHILAIAEATIGFLNKQGLLNKLPTFNYEKPDINETED